MLYIKKAFIEPVWYLVWKVSMLYDSVARKDRLGRLSRSKRLYFNISFETMISFLFQFVGHSRFFNEISSAIWYDGKQTQKKTGRVLQELLAIANIHSLTSRWPPPLFDSFSSDVIRGHVPGLRADTKVPKLLQYSVCKVALVLVMTFLTMRPCMAFSRSTAEGGQRAWLSALRCCETRVG